MRLRRTIVSIWVGVACVAALAAPAIGWASGGPGSDPGAGSTGGPDSVPAIGAESYWLPLPVEEIETPEALDDPPRTAAGFMMRAAIRSGMASIRRVAATGMGRSLLVELSLLGEGAAAQAGTVSLRTIGSGLKAVAGRLGTRGSGSPFLEAIGLSRRASRVPAASADAPSLEAPSTAASPSIEGIGFERSQEPGSSIPGAWTLAGRRVEDGAKVGALGLRGSFGRGSWSASGGTLEGVPTGAVACELRSAAGAAACEMAFTREGPAALLSAESAPGPLRIRGRWRRRSAGIRRTGCELSVDGGPRIARAKLFVSGGPSGPGGAAGRAELECRLAPLAAGPINLRAGRSRTEGFNAASGITIREERYAVLDAAIVRSEGRGLSLLATRRARDAAGGTRWGSSLGGRLELTWRRRGRLEVLVEAVRADLAGGAAWGSGLFAGGSTALRTRTRPGVAASTRGALRLGRWEFGGLIEGREDERGRRASAATIWIQRALPGVAR